MKDKDRNTDNLYFLKAGTEVFSIILQENIIFSNDVFVRITHTIYNDDDVIFACVQLKFINPMISNISGKDETTFINKTHGEISTRISKLLKVNNEN